MKTKKYKSEGTGFPDKSLLKKCGENVIIEDGVRIFHPENLSIGDNVYIGHDTIIKGYYKDEFIIGDNVWIGQACYLHAAGGIEIASFVGIGPHVKMHAAYHIDEGREKPILIQPLGFRKITIQEDVNIGMGAIIMNGVTLKKGTKVGAGSVVTRTYPEYSVLVGSPAKPIKER